MYAVLKDKPLDQWKVSELKEELKKRNLAIKGGKYDLVKRLDEAVRHQHEKNDNEKDASSSLHSDQSVPNHQDTNTDMAGPSNEISLYLDSLKQDNNADMAGPSNEISSDLDSLKQDNNADIAGPSNEISSDLDSLKQDTNTDMAGLSKEILSYLDSLKQLYPQEPRKIDNVVGLEEATNTIINYLLRKTSKFDVIRIFGMAGIGKTTLASNIFHHPRIQKEFGTIPWINLSTPSQLLEELVEKLQSLKKNPVSTNKKLLLIMDDVLSGEMWNKIKKTLPKGCKVLVTTSYRFFHDSKTSITIRLKCMDENTGWELLHLLIYGRIDDNSPPELERIGKRIVRKCGGIPHAIELICRILVEKSSSTTGRNTSEKIDMKLWEEVADNVKSYLFNTGNPQDMGKSISTRYNMLCSDLKECFLYLGMLPAGVEIPVWKLTELWIAEGLIKQTDEKTVEAVAKSNVAELSKRNLIIVMKRHVNSSPKTCCLLEMVRYFCINEVAFRNANICHGLRSTTRTDGPNIEPPLSIEEIENCRRLFIHVSSSTVLLDFLSGKQKLRNVQSFLCFNKSDSSGSLVLEKRETQSMMDSFNMLRVLEANAIKFSKFPHKLTKLLQLKYMALSGDKIKTLPTTISRFCYIQTIIVNTMSPVLKVEADIWEMMQLRLFKTKAAIILSKKGNGNGPGGEKLRTLAYLSPKCCTDQVANKAKNLIMLGIRGELARLQDSNFFEKLNMVNKLKLVNDHEVEARKNRLLRQNLPNNFPPKLKTLVLSATFLKWEKMSILKKLSELRMLIIKNNAFMGDCWNCTSDGGFHQLNSLSIRSTNLKRWTLESGASTFPKLRTLELVHCQDLEGLPLELGEELPPLGKLTIKSVSASAVSSAKEIEQARRKLKLKFRLFIDTEEDISSNGKMFAIEQHLGGF